MTWLSSVPSCLAARGYLYHRGAGYSKRGLFLGRSPDAGGGGGGVSGGGRGGRGHGDVPLPDGRWNRMVMGDTGGRFVLAVASFGMVLELPKICGLVRLRRGLCWLVYLVVKAGTGSHDTGAFLSSLSVAPYGTSVCQDFQGAGQCVPGAGNFTLVPGTSIYNSVYYARPATAGRNPCITWWKPFAHCGAIALAVFLMDSEFKLGGKEEKDKSVKLGLGSFGKI